ncbi:helix-turn-helix domain-containing protein [Neobacillus novalis]|uniref:helix-turn-helix domain-containing protein n=1 Tax=Neobacillus novalis TaxID=220687 RepID=UPI0014718E45|nr:helix-turn-helix transcriptional regulator [Neobacillus novalis]
MIELTEEEGFVEVFTNEIRERRREKSFSLKQLEMISGVSASFIMRIEKHQRKNPGLIVSLKLSKALDIDLSVLFERYSKQK